MEYQPIATIHNDFPTKFGLPRQSGLSEHLISQIVMDEFFTMNMLIDITRMNCSIHELEKTLKEHLKGMEIHVMHENIFYSMHSI